MLLFSSLLPTKLSSTCTDPCRRAALLSGRNKLHHSRSFVNVPRWYSDSDSRRVCVLVLPPSVGLLLTDQLLQQRQHTAVGRKINNLIWEFQDNNRVVGLGLAHLHFCPLLVSGQLTKQDRRRHIFNSLRTNSQRPNLFQRSASLHHPHPHLLQGTRNTSAGCGSTLAPEDTLTRPC